MDKRFLQDQSGESMVETLFSLLVAMLSVALLLTAVAVSSSIDLTAFENNTNFLSSITSAEKQEGTPAGAATVTITEQDAPPASTPFSATEEVSLYGGDEMYTYIISPPLESIPVSQSDGEASLKVSDKPKDEDS